MRWPVISSGATMRGSVVGANSRQTSDSLEREITGFVIL
jgi:hypothetical protein